MTINDRIKYFRKEIKGINQKEFAKVLGVTQSGVSYMEQKGSTVADSSIKAICSVVDVNEEWLRNGTEPMFAQPTTFSLDDCAKAKGATPLELKIMKTYFELDPDIRKAAMDFFKKQLLSAVAADPGLLIPDDQDDLEKLNPPAEAGNGTRKETSQKAPSLPELG